MRALRDYQLEASGSTVDRWAAGMTRPAIVLPTGCGKTDVIAHRATEEVHRGGRVLMLAHRGELLDQITARCQMHDPRIPVGRVQAGANTHRRPIVAAMAPTLARPARQRQIRDPFSLVIVDECHHAAARGYVDILEWAGCFREQDPTRAMGVTATLTRGTRPRRGEKGLGDVWQGVAFHRDIAWAIDSGWLVRPYGRAVVTDHLDLERAHTRAGDYVEGEVGDMVAQDAEQIVRAWLSEAVDDAHPDGRITGAFVPSIPAAHELAAAFAAVGVKAEVVTGTTPPTERGDVARGTGIYGRLAAGVTRVLVGVGVTTEGWDCPPIECILMARPTKLPGLYQQIVGRGLRPCPTTGKRDCLVLDVVGASRKLHLQTLMDLLPGIEYDGEPPLPACRGCERPVAVTPAELARCVGEPCPLQGACPVEELEARDPDGGRARLKGPAQYAEVDLLGGLRAGGLNWLETGAGTVFVRSGAFYVLLWHNANDTWSAGWITAAGRLDGAWPLEYASFAHARAVAERLPQAKDAEQRDAPWRTARKRASDKQVAKARRLGIEAPESYTSGGLSDAIEVIIASRRIDVE